MHVPLGPQLKAPQAGWGAPAGVASHCPAWLHASHGPVHADSQQAPRVQEPEAHSTGAAQGEPFPRWDSQPSSPMNCPSGQPVHSPRSHPGAPVHWSPMQAASRHSPSTHACPTGHGVPLHPVGRQKPLPHVLPAAHATPTHAASWHVPSTHTSAAEHRVLPHDRGQHCPSAQALPAGQETPAQASATQRLPSQKKPAAALQSRSAHSEG